jgi:plastocyanin
MASYRHMFTLLSLALFSGLTLAQSVSNADPSAVTVSGQVILVQSPAPRPLPDASHAVVWLVPVDAVQPVHLTTQKAHYRLVQRNKSFQPGLLVVPVGSTVDFPNADPWFHNVFSLYRGKRFDLGLYQAGSQRSVIFDKPGPSYLFCNIHPEMTGVVLAVDSELFAMSDKTGRYSIAGVTPGNYILHVWYENATPESLQILQRSIAIDQGGRNLPPVSITVVKQVHAEHKNKYGQDYDPDTLKTGYE